MQPIQITCRFFSLLKEQLGTDVLKITLANPTSSSEFLRQIAKEHQFEHLIPVIRLAINRQYITQDSPLSSGDEVAFITPVAGG